MLPNDGGPSCASEYGISISAVCCNLCLRWALGLSVKSCLCSAEADLRPAHQGPLQHRRGIRGFVQLLVHIQEGCLAVLGPAQAVSLHMGACIGFIAVSM